MTFGIKWFFLIMIANDGYSLFTSFYEVIWRDRINSIKTKSNTLTEQIHMLLSYVLLVYSYFGGYIKIASAILVAQNFSDLFLYIYKVTSLNGTKKYFISDT